MTQCGPASSGVLQRRPSPSSAFMKHGPPPQLARAGCWVSWSWCAAVLVLMVVKVVAVLPAPPPPAGAQQAGEDGAWSEFLHISVTSSPHLLLITVNGEVVEEVTTTRANISTSRLEYTPWELSSGIHLLVLHPTDGRLMMRRILTTALFGSVHEVPSVLSSLTPGHVVVMAIKNDAAQHLTPLARRLLARVGVRSSLSLHLRESLAWVGTLAGPVWGEARTMGAFEEVVGIVDWASGVTLDLMVPRVVHDDSCLTEDDAGEAARTAFCRLYDGYGDLCYCPRPAPLTFHAPELEGSTILDVPLLVLASNRPTYLYRSLVTLLRQPGGTLARILVLVDGHHQEVADLLSLLQVQYEEQSSVGVSIGAKISDHYRHALTVAFRRFPNASKVILMEEDLLASPDFFSYFNQTARVLEVDPSVCCVSGWSDLGHLHSAHDPHLLRRVEVVAGLGWMLSRDTAMALLRRWPSHNEDHDWDIWVRHPGVLGGRECVVPDVSRTFHIGLMGSHAAGLLHTAFFANKPIPAQAHFPLQGVHRLTEMEYEEDIYQVLEGDPYVLHSRIHPCHPDYLPRNLTDRPVVVFIEMSAPGDYYAWQVLARCLGLWDLDTRAHHRGLFRFYFYETEVLVVGFPFSDYSYLKPPGAPLLAVNTSKELSALDLIPLTHRIRFRRPELELFVPYHVLPVPNL
nr:protein O-linked-mannose beta-1,2-N-acetylglucosaminyltransferase 1-like isoform X2 [Procambarus clarkii]